MMKFKQYKAVSPEETIYRIRVILNKTGILLKESSCVKDGLYACRLTVNNDSLSVLDIGTNGKGRSYEYALASGYAEFMERLQNGIVYNQTLLNFVVKNILETHDETSPIKRAIFDQKLQSDFIFDANETFWNADTVIAAFRNDLKKFYHIEEDKDIYSEIKRIVKDEQALMIPVYSVFERKEILYPINWALMTTGSNGMCAGNTPSEAILQGMCEIFERYSASQIFFNHLTPPTLDIELFKDTVVYEKMELLRKRYGYEFIIKDCSLGKGLPVIGLLIINHKNNTYNFKLGADFVPAIALERCLTEVYQSKHGFIGLPLLKQETSNDYECYSKMLQNGTGNWPESIFFARPSYHFSGFNESLGIDNLVDLKYGCKLIEHLGSNLYIRDNSYLGFPTYYVIAPGLSSICTNITELYNNMETDPAFIMSKYKGNFDLNKHIHEFVKEVEYSFLKKGEFKFNEIIAFYNSKELNDLDPNLFLCMAYYKIGNYQKSYHYICNFLKGKNDEYKYYFAASEYILLRYLKNVKDDDIKSTLITKYGKVIANDIIEDMHSPEDIFRYYDFSRHFDWKNMDVNKNSYFLRILALDKKLKNAIVNNPIKQGDLEKIFE